MCCDLVNDPLLIGEQSRLPGCTSTAEPRTRESGVGQTPYDLLACSPFGLRYSAASKGARSVFKNRFPRLTHRAFHSAAIAATSARSPGLTEARSNFLAAAAMRVSPAATAMGGVSSPFLAR